MNNNSFSFLGITVTNSNYITGEIEAIFGGIFVLIGIILLIIGVETQKYYNPPPYSQTITSKTIVCTSCGFENPFNNTTCVRCGATLMRSTQQTYIKKEEGAIGEKQFVFCAYCGAKNFSDSKFCEKCGKEIRTIS
jgi:ribosomal protein L40E